MVVQCGWKNSWYSFYFHSFFIRVIIKKRSREGIQHQQPQIGLFVSIAKGEIIRFLNYSSRYHLDYLTDGRGSGCGCGCASPRELICFHSSTFNATLCRRRENKIPPRKGLCLSCLKFMLMMCQWVTFGRFKFINRMGWHKRRKNEWINITGSKWKRHFRMMVSHSSAGAPQSPCTRQTKPDRGKPWPITNSVFLKSLPTKTFWHLKWSAMISLSLGIVFLCKWLSIVIFVGH